MGNDATADEGRPWLTPSAALNRANQAAHPGWTNQPSRAGHSLRYGFRVGSLHLMIEPEVMSEVLWETPVYALPGSPQWIAGLVNLRGSLLPVFDLHILFGFSPEAGKDRDLVALDSGAASVCLFVDDLPRRVEAGGPAGSVPPLPAYLRGHVGAAFKADGSIWMEFHHDSFFRSLASAWSAGEEVNPW